MRFVRPIAVAVIATLSCAVLVGCAADEARYTGRVTDDTVTISAPALVTPSVNLDAGFAPTAQGASAAGTGAIQGRSAVATAVSITRLGSVVRVKSVAVAAGDHISAGQEIARLDSSALDANIAVAKASLASSRAQVGVLDDALDTVASNRSTLVSSRRQVDDAATQLASTRTQLAIQLADLKALLAKVEALGPGGGRPPVPPGGITTGTPPPGSLPPGAVPDPAQLRAGIARLTTALAKIDAGLAQVASGRARLSSASAKLSDARVQITDLRRLARVGVDGAKVGVQIAEYQRSLAVLRSPVDGTVVRAAVVGDMLAPGAAVAEIRRNDPPRVTTWIAPEQLTDIEIGTRVGVSGDWFPRGADGRGGTRDGVSPIPGRVTAIGTRAEYPPTSFATSEIHLTRAIRIEMTLSPSAEQPALPPGTPVDVRFLGK